MITRIVTLLRRAIDYIQEHPQLLLVLFLLIAIPTLFLYSGQRFLDAGKANQDTLQKERIGLLQDSLVSILRSNDFSAAKIQPEISYITSINPDIIGLTISRLHDGEIVPLAGLEEKVLGIPIQYTDFHRSAAVRIDESIIFETSDAQDRIWLAYRAIESVAGQFYFIETVVSLAATDALFAKREREAYFSLLLIYVFIFIIVLWHVRLTDYRSMYLQVKEANQTKDLFTNMIAHELRAPLTAIRGYASMIEESHEDDTKAANRIRLSSERLLTIVNDLLDVARIQSGKLSVTQTTFSLASIVTAVVDEQRISASRKQLSIMMEVPEAITVQADQQRLQQVLTNVLSNAIKYTPEGSIIIHAQPIVKGVEIRVKDTGSGIASPDQQKLFAPFFRVQSKDVSQITGTGLGMWITKQLVELMSGTIDVESIKGVGTHVVITLPAPSQR